MTPPTFRGAIPADLPRLVALLADDVRGVLREVVSDSPDAAYARAFEAIQASPDNEVVVGEVDGEVVACLQLTLVPGLGHQGALYGVIEGVRVASTHRGRRIGEALVREALARAKNRGARVVRLVTSKPRVDAQRFYARLGFAQSHVAYEIDPR